MKRVLLALALCSTLSGQNVVWSVNNPSPFASSDKRLHFVAGAVAGAWGTAIAHRLKLKNPWIYGLLSAAALGYAKEVYDRRHGGKAEVADALNTAVGGACAGITLQVSYRW